VAAACDTDEGRSRTIADKVAAFQGESPQLSSSVEDLLKGDEVHAVDISLPHDLHHAVACACLENGLHVTLEKPLALTLRAGRRILEAADAAGRVFQVAENYRREPGHRAVRWAIERGWIGEPRMVFWIDVGERLWHWGWRDEKVRAGGGWVLDGGVHFADLFRYHVGEVARVAAFSKALQPVRYRDVENRADPIGVDVEDSVAALLEFEDGAMGQWTSTTAAPGRGFNRRVIHGSEGSIGWDEGLTTPARTLDLETLVEEHRNALGDDEKERLFPFGITHSVATELKEFVDACLDGGDVEVDGAEGYRDQAICMAVYESAEIGRAVSVDEVASLKIETYQAPLNHLIGLG
jgi:predicted dehydrogenase